MQADDEDVDAEEVEQERGETDDRDPRRAPTAPPGRRPSVQIARVDDPGDERPRLLRVPTPVATPRRLRPDRARDNCERPDREREGEHAVRRAVEHLRNWQHAPDPGEPGRA